MPPAIQTRTYKSSMSAEIIKRLLPEAGAMSRSGKSNNYATTPHVTAPHDESSIQTLDHSLLLSSIPRAPCIRHPCPATRDLSAHVHQRPGSQDLVDMMTILLHVSTNMTQSLRIKDRSASRVSACLLVRLRAQAWRI